MMFKTLASAVCLLPMTCAVAWAAEPAGAGWDLRMGLGRLQFHESATVQIGGAPFPGGDARLTDVTTLVLEGRYRFNDRFALGLTMGLPPETKVSGAGTAAPFGELGRVRFGPAALTGQWTLPLTNDLRARLGAGVARLIIFKEKDGALSNLKAQETWGSVLQVGLDMATGRDAFVSLDVKRIGLKSVATGTAAALGGAPARAEMTLNPVVLFVGMGWRF